MMRKSNTQWRSHGANPEKLYEQFGIKMPDSVIDFSTNTNVIKSNYDYDIDLKSIVSGYPDDESSKLRKELSKQLRVDKEKILVTNGSNEAIYLIVSRYEKVAVLQPTYSEYERAINASNKQIVHINSFSEIDEYRDVDLIIICNPNNPTGRFYDNEKLKRIIKTCSVKNIDVMIDEAYIDFLLKDHEPLNMSQFSNVYVLKSMTKIFHLSGIRLGFVVSSKEKIEVLKSKQPSWSVNALAQVIGLKCLKDTEFLNRTIDYYRTETKRLVTALSRIGYDVLPSTVHYFLVKVDEDETLIRYLLENGIVVKHTRNFIGLDGKYIRVCTRESMQNDYLIKKLKEYKVSGCKA